MMTAGVGGGPEAIWTLTVMKELNLFDRPVMESATAGAGRDSHGPSDESCENFGRPVNGSNDGNGR